MTIQLLETKVYKGEEIVAVHAHQTHLFCTLCVGIKVKNCMTEVGQCERTRRPDGQSVIWMLMEDALKARVRGKLPDA